MAINERDRLRLHDRLGEVLGVEEAGLLMELLPPTGEDDVATKADVRQAVTEIRTEMDGRFAQMEGRFATIDQRFAQMEGRFATIDQRFAEVDGRLAVLDARFDQVDGRFTELTGRMELRFAQQTRLLVAVMIGFALTVWISLLVGG